MKILIINFSDIEGGAARAAYRLHQALLGEDIDSNMLVQKKTIDDYTVLREEHSIQKFISRIRPNLDRIALWRYKNRKKTFFSSAWVPSRNIIDKINEINPDIVHLHWICEGMIRIEDIAKIKAPIIWSLHDNWAFTGGCHVKWECEKYKSNCGACPQLRSNKENDLSRSIWNRKNKAFSTIENITIIGLSHWINELSKESSLLKDKKHINIPNLINTEIFKPFDKEMSRELWNLPQDKKLILFGAVRATSDLNKGFHELSESINKLKDKDIEFVVFGSTKPKESQNFPFKTHYLGYLHDDVSLISLYSAVDVVIVPSLQENLSNVIMESLSCATPVVAFDIGGNSDMIEHLKNGYLALPYNIDDLTKGINWVLTNTEYNNLCINARQKIVNNFSEKIVISKYIELYKSLL